MRIGVVGLGRMGRPMALNLHKAGHQLTVYDTSPDAISGLLKQCDAERGSSPGHAAANADAVIISVPGPAADAEVLFGKSGILAGAKAGLLIVDTTTITVPQSRDNFTRAAAAGVDYLECPVSGGQEGAAAGTLTAMAGGEVRIFERAQLILKCLASQIHLVGGSGCGTAIKLINQAIYVSYMTAFAEGLAVGEANGISLEMLLKILSTSAAGTPAIENKFAEIRGQSNKRFSINNALLFLNLAQEAFKDAGMKTPVFEAAAASLSGATSRGLGAEDLIVARKKYLENSGQSTA